MTSSVEGVDAIKRLRPMAHHAAFTEAPSRSLTRVFGRHARIVRGADSVDTLGGVGRTRLSCLHSSELIGDHTRPWELAALELGMQNSAVVHHFKRID